MNTSHGEIKKTITVTLNDLSDNDLSNMIVALQPGLQGTTTATHMEGWALLRALKDARTELSRVRPSDAGPAVRQSFENHVMNQKHGDA